MYVETIQAVKSVTFLSSSFPSPHLPSFTQAFTQSFNQPANQKVKTSHVTGHLLYQFKVQCYRKCRDGEDRILYTRNSLCLLLLLSLSFLTIPSQDAIIYMWSISALTSKIFRQILFNQMHKARDQAQGTHRLSFQLFLPFAPSLLALLP